MVFFSQRFYLCQYILLEARALNLNKPTERRGGCQERGGISEERDKLFCTAKETINKAKRQPIEWEKTFANDATNKALISKIRTQTAHTTQPHTHTHTHTHTHKPTQSKTGQKT